MAKSRNRTGKAARPTEEAVVHDAVESEPNEMAGNEEASAQPVAEQRHGGGESEELSSPAEPIAAPSSTDEVAPPERAPERPTAPASRRAKAPGALKDGIVLRLKMMVLGNPNIRDAEIIAKLEDDGFAPSPSTIASFRTDFIHSLRVLKGAGFDVPVPGEILAPEPPSN